MIFAKIMKIYENKKRFYVFFSNLDEKMTNHISIYLHKYKFTINFSFSGEWFNTLYKYPTRSRLPPHTRFVPLSYMDLSEDLIPRQQDALLL